MTLYVPRYRCLARCLVPPNAWLCALALMRSPLRARVAAVTMQTINAINNESVSLLKFHAGTTTPTTPDIAAGASPGPPGPPPPPPPPFAIERQVWLTLYEACRLSIKLGTVIVLKPAGA